MGYSFRDVVVDGKIWSPTAGTIDLSLHGENKIPYLQSVEISYAFNGETEVTVNFAPTYKEALRLIDDLPWFRLGNTLAVRWGYNDGQPGHMGNWIYSFMLPPEPSFGEEITLSVKGTPYGWCMNRVSSKREWSTQTKPRSFASVAKEILVKYGFNEPNFLCIGQDQIHLMEEERGNLIQSGDSDLQFLVLEANAASMQMIMEGKDVLFIDMSSAFELKKVAAEFHMYGKIDTDKNIYPLMGFTPKGFGPLFLPKGGAVKAIVQGPNSDPEKEPVVLESSDSTGQENHFSGPKVFAIPGKNAPAPSKKTPKASVELDKKYEATKFYPLTMADDYKEENAQKYLDGFRTSNAGDFGIEVDFDSIAIPTIFPGQIVRLRGVSNYFSTDYRLKGVDISIESGGANMTCHGMSKGIPASVEETLTEEVKTHDIGILGVECAPGEEPGVHVEGYEKINEIMDIDW